MIEGISRYKTIKLLSELFIPFVLLCGFCFVFVFCLGWCSQFFFCLVVLVVEEEF